MTPFSTSFVVIGTADDASSSSSPSDTSPAGYTDRGPDLGEWGRSVSYTHLTLPTKA